MIDHFKTCGHTEAVSSSEARNPDGTITSVTTWVCLVCGAEFTCVITWDPTEPF